jgi:early secretory antigenic target protein ESAT-6
MGEIHVSLEALQSGQAGINKTYGALQATLEQLNSDLEPMIQSWTGTAQEAYLVQKKNWNEGADALAQVLQNIARSLGDAHDNYHATHQATKQIWS